MALYDAMFEFSNGQAITSSDQADYAIDFQNSDLEMGAGNPVYLNVRVNTAFATGDSATLAVALVYDDTGVDSGSTTVFTTPAIAATALTAGAWVLRVPLPYNIDEERYVGLYYTVGTGTFTAGAIDAWLDHGPQSSYDTQVAESNI